MSNALTVVGKDTSTALLPPEKQEEAALRAHSMQLTQLDQIQALGAEPQRKLEALGALEKGVRAIDLGPVGDSLVSLEQGFEILTPDDFVNAKPDVWDWIGQRFHLFRRYLGLMERLVKRYEQATLLIEGRAAAVQTQTNILKNDLALKETQLTRYQQHLIELLVAAKMGEIKQAELVNQQAQLEGGQVTIDTELKVADLQLMIPAVAARINDLLMLADYIRGLTIRMSLSRSVQHGLISKMESGIRTLKIIWQAATQEALSALRMAKAADIQARHRQVTEKILLQSSGMTLDAAIRAAEESVRPLVAIEVLRQVNANTKTAIGEVAQTFKSAIPQLEAYNEELLRMESELEDAAANPSAVQIDQTE